MKAIDLVSEAAARSLAGLGSALAAGYSLFEKRPERPVPPCAEKAFDARWGRA
jgi:hypothetical protein